MKTRVEGVASCETPPVLPRNSPPLQASARPGRKESFFDALTLWNRICRLKPSCQRSLQIKTGAANECDLKALCLSLCRSSTSRLRGQSCSRHRCPGPRPSCGSPSWSSACRSLKGENYTDTKCSHKTLRWQIWFSPLKGRFFGTFSSLSVILVRHMVLLSEFRHSCGVPIPAPGSVHFMLSWKETPFPGCGHL